MLSGKELFNYNAALFTDDDAAISAKEEKALTAETKVTHDEEDEKSKFEREKLMADQEQLMEIYRIEDEERKRTLLLWRQACENSYKNKGFIFDFNGVDVNGRVFAIKEDEMLDEFEDDEVFDDEEDEVQTVK